MRILKEEEDGKNAPFNILIIIGNCQFHRQICPLLEEQELEGNGVGQKKEEKNLPFSDPPSSAPLMVVLCHCRRLVFGPHTRTDGRRLVSRSVDGATV